MLFLQLQQLYNCNPLFATLIFAKITINNVILTLKDKNMNAIYKKGVPAVVAQATFTTSPVSTAIGQASNPATPVSAVAGKPVLLGPNSNNGTTVVGQKVAGSLNANGVLTLVPGRNTPQS